MATFVSQELRDALLNSYFTGGARPTQLFLRLYTDNATITDTSTLADVSANEQVGSGYAVKTIAMTDWTVEADATGRRARMANKTWTTTADNWGTLRWAVICTSADDTGTILLAKDYGGGKTVTGIGANVTVDTLFYQLND